MKNFRFFYSFCLSLFFAITTAYSQGNNPVITNHEFLLTPPDARTAGMGNAGGAISADANAIFWNPGKIVFNKKKAGASVSFIPQRNTPGGYAYQANMAGYYKLSNERAIAISSRYIYPGRIVINDWYGLSSDLSGKNMAFSLAYSHKINKHLGLGITGRLIHFDNDFKQVYVYDDQQTINHNDDQSGYTATFDIGLFYSKPVQVFGKVMQWNTGLTVSNLGPKSHYQPNFEYFSPAKMQLSNALSTNFGKNHQLTWAIDISKLLAPTPNFNPFSATNNSPLPKVSWRKGVFGSFGDAPEGFKEEFREIIWSTGFEYQFKDVLSLRTGYHFEQKDKGNRSDFTVGVGTRLGKVRLDMSYLTKLNGSPFPPEFILPDPLPVNEFRITAGISF